MLYRFNDFELDDEICALGKDGHDVPIRPQALDLLLYLLRHRDRVVTKQEILEAVWKGIAVSDSTIPQAVLAIRRAVDDDQADPVLIQTVRSRGYRFIGKIEVSVRDRGSDTRPAIPVRGAFVGRKKEIEQLGEMVRGASEGRGGLALVSGAPGMGKTRLLFELRSRASKSNARVLNVRCPTEEGVFDMWVWIQVL